MSTSQEHENMNISMLSEVSGMDNSLSLAEIDRIIGNLIGKDAESRAVADNGEQSPVLRSPVIKHSPHLVNPSASSSSSTLHRFVSPNVRRIVSPAQSTPSPFGTDRPEQSLDSPTDVPLFSDGSHGPHHCACVRVHGDRCLELNCARDRVIVTNRRCCGV